MAARNGLQIGAPLDRAQTAFAVSTTAPSADPLAVLQSDPEVLAAEPDLPVSVPELGLALNQSTVAILDSLGDRSLVSYAGSSVWDGYVKQPAAEKIRAFAAQASYGPGAGVVAVIDTGVDWSHPALAKSLVAGYDFTRDVAGMATDWLDLAPQVRSTLMHSAIAMTGKQTLAVNQSTVAILDQAIVSALGPGLPPSFGHGTMTASLVHLVAPAAKIMPLKAFSANGTGTLTNVLRAIYYAVDHGAKVINMSFSMAMPSSELETAVRYATAHKVVAIASVGNSGKAEVVYPAAWIKNVLGTASTTESDSRSSFSNYGAKDVQIAAPGESIVTAYPGNNYAVASGTSFSAALASGGTALLVQIAAKLDQAGATDALSQAVFLGPDLGAGRIDLVNACRYSSSRQ